MDTNSVFIKIKEARTDANLTQVQLGKRIGKSKQWVSELEKGNIRLSYDMAIKIANECKKELNFFAEKVH